MSLSLWTLGRWLLSNLVLPLFFTKLRQLLRTA